jgi:hypothetical protein
MDKYTSDNLDYYYGLFRRRVNSCLKLGLVFYDLDSSMFFRNLKLKNYIIKDKVWAGGSPRLRSH